MAFIAGAGAAGGLPNSRPVNPYPKLPIPRAPAVQMPGALAPPVFQMPPPIDQSSFASQAAAETQRQIDPILQQITARSNAQALYSGQAISALTNAYADRLAGLKEDASAAYGTGLKVSQGMTGGVQKYLTGAGKAAAATEGKATGLAGKSAGSDVNLASEGAGAGNAAAAIQEGMTQALKTAQGAAVKYASALPGFAQQEGAQIKNTTLQQLAAVMANQLAEVTAQAPTIYHQLYNEFLDRAENDRAFQLDMAKFQYGIESDAYDRNVAARQRAASIVAPNAPTNNGRLAYWQKVAAERESKDPLGRQWVGTTTGIHPLTVGGKVQHTADWTQSQAKAILAQADKRGFVTAQDAAQIKALTGITITPGESAAITKAKIAAQNKITVQKMKDQAAARRAQDAQTAEMARVQAKIAAGKATAAEKIRAQHISQAIARTKATGYVWVAGPNGIRQVRTPDGKPVRVKGATKGPTTTVSSTGSPGKPPKSTTTTTTYPPGTSPPKQKQAPSQGSGNPLGPGANTGKATGASVSRKRIRGVWYVKRNGRWVPETSVLPKLATA